jgi:hypothetical protein
LFFAKNEILSTIRPSISKTKSISINKSNSCPFAYALALVFAIVAIVDNPKY